MNTQIFLIMLFIENYSVIRMGIWQNKKCMLWNSTLHSFIIYGGHFVSWSVSVVQFITCLAYAKRAQNRAVIVVFELWECPSSWWWTFSFFAVMQKWMCTSIDCLFFFFMCFSPSFFLSLFNREFSKNHEKIKRTKNFLATIEKIEYQKWSTIIIISMIQSSFRCQKYLQMQFPNIKVISNSCTSKLSEVHVILEMCSTYQNLRIVYFPLT